MDYINGFIYSPRRALGKLILIVLFPLFVTCSAVIIYNQQTQSQSSMLASEPTVLLRIPIKEKIWADIGAVVEPTVTFSVKTITGYEKNEFILDSGAVISSLSREWAEKIGIDLAYAKRVTFKGFGNTTSFAYQSTVTIMFGDQTITLPMVFTESTGTRSLIGRKGFFDNYTIAFNHRDKMIEITQ
jgi:hypothetical protein